VAIHPTRARGLKLIQSTSSTLCLLGSRFAAHNRELFFKAQLLFWLLAAIDGHGKNFSLFIEPDSSYRMTPLYELMQAFPLFDNGSIQLKKAKMTMFLEGQDRQYHFAMIQPRHFISTAVQVGFSVEITRRLMLEMAMQTEAVIVHVTAELPDDFQETISPAIFNG
jgi:serine/threonine-protein kinase HipA